PIRTGCPASLSEAGSGAVGVEGVLTQGVFGRFVELVAGRKERPGDELWMPPLKGIGKRLAVQCLVKRGADLWVEVRGLRLDAGTPLRSEEPRDAEVDVHRALAGALPFLLELKTELGGQGDIRESIDRPGQQVRKQ